MSPACELRCVSVGGGCFGRENTKTPACLHCLLPCLFQLSSFILAVLMPNMQQRRVRGWTSSCVEHLACCIHEVSYSPTSLVVVSLILKNHHHITKLPHTSNLNGKGLTGSIPSDPGLWSGLTALTSLDLANNALQGSVPSAIKSAPVLTNL